MWGKLLSGKIRIVYHHREKLLSGTSTNMGKVAIRNINRHRKSLSGKSINMGKKVAIRKVYRYGEKSCYQESQSTWEKLLSGKSINMGKKSCYQESLSKWGKVAIRKVDRHGKKSCYQVSQSIWESLSGKSTSTRKTTVRKTHYMCIFFFWKLPSGKYIRQKKVTIREVHYIGTSYHSGSTLDEKKLISREIIRVRKTPHWELSEKQKLLYRNIGYYTLAY